MCVAAADCPGVIGCVVCTRPWIVFRRLNLLCSLTFTCEAPLAAPVAIFLSRMVVSVAHKGLCSLSKVISAVRKHIRVDVGSPGRNATIFAGEGSLQDERFLRSVRESYNSVKLGVDKRAADGAVVLLVFH